MRKMFLNLKRTQLKSNFNHLSGETLRTLSSPTTRTTSKEHLTTFFTINKSWRCSSYLRCPMKN